METTIATVMITVIATIALIGLGAIVWAICKLGRRVSRMEGLCRGFESTNSGIFNEIENQNREHDVRQKEILKQIEDSMETIWRRFEDGDKDSEKHREELNRKIDSLHEWNERNMDKRLDSVYRKIHSLQNKVTIPNPELKEQGY